MIPPTITGAVERYLLEGPYAEKLALLEYDENTLVAASDLETKEEINLSEIHETDIDNGLESLVEHIKYYGN